LSQVDLIAVTKGPGLMGSLLVGISAAKALSFSLQKPLIGVDHVLAHIYAGVMEGKNGKPLRFPLLGLVVSGGHTMILRMDGPDEVKILGRTIDDAAKKAFDKVAKILGLGYPGGPEIDKLAKGEFPGRLLFKKPILSKDSLDFTFSGIKTAVYYKVLGIQKTGRLTPAMKKEIASHFQEAACQALMEKTLQAARAEKLKNIVVGGGVSANSRLRHLLKKEAVFPSMALCQDNAAMIAGMGTALYRAGRRDGLDLTGYANGHKA
jgi:N6-L-threonylcarbamoyladenine synthase